MLSRILARTVFQGWRVALAARHIHALGHALSSGRSLLTTDLLRADRERAGCGLETRVDVFPAGSKFLENLSSQPPQVV